MTGMAKSAMPTNHPQSSIVDSGIRASGRSGNPGCAGATPRRADAFWPSGGKRLKSNNGKITLSLAATGTLIVTGGAIKETTGNANNIPKADASNAWRTAARQATRS